MYLCHEQGFEKITERTRVTRSLLLQSSIQSNMATCVLSIVCADTINASTIGLDKILRLIIPMSNPNKYFDIEIVISGGSRGRGGRSPGQNFFIFM